MTGKRYTPAQTAERLGITTGYLRQLVSKLKIDLPICPACGAREYSEATIRRLAAHMQTHRPGPRSRPQTSKRGG